MTTHRSILELDPTHPETQQAIGDAHLLHHHVMSGFADQFPEHGDFFADPLHGHPNRRESLNILHAVDHRPDGTIWLMVQSDQPGEWSNTRISQALTRAVVHRTHTPETRGDIRYQIVTNPTHSSAATRKRRGLKNPVEIEEWWRRTAKRIGLDVVGKRVDLVSTQTLRAPSKNKGSRRFAITAATVAGAATVADPDAVAEACRRGVGKGRAYGCGLLLTLPAR